VDRFEARANCESHGPPSPAPEPEKRHQPTEDTSRGDLTSLTAQPRAPAVPPKRSHESESENCHARRWNRTKCSHEARRASQPWGNEGMLGLESASCIASARPKGRWPGPTRVSRSARRPHAGNSGAWCVSQSNVSERAAHDQHQLRRPSRTAVSWTRCLPCCCSSRAGLCASGPHSSRGGPAVRRPAGWPAACLPLRKPGAHGGWRRISGGASSAGVCLGAVWRRLATGRTVRVGSSRTAV
jgi:hypothetical protein